MSEPSLEELADELDAGAYVSTEERKRIAAALRERAAMDDSRFTDEILQRLVKAEARLSKQEEELKLLREVAQVGKGCTNYCAMRPPEKNTGLLTQAICQCANRMDAALAAYDEWRKANA